MKNISKIKKIVKSLELSPNDTVFEIGPGHGELTKELRLGIKDLKKVQIIAIEKDKKLADDLRLKINDLGLTNIQIINGDALQKLPPLIVKLPNYRMTNYKIVGNIPYYITGRLLRILGDLKKKPKTIVLTVQKEVAERITAKPPQMNLLAASVQFWAKPEIIDFISKNDFEPAPEVDSAVIKLATDNPKEGHKTETKNYYKLIRALFKQPRKTILNNITADSKLAKATTQETKPRPSSGA